MYLMPIFFMFLLNSYSSGLSYYYFLSNVFSIGQFYIIKAMVDPDKVRVQLLAASNKKKPVTKSKFQLKLEEMTKKQQEMARLQQQQQQKSRKK